MEIHNYNEIILKSKSSFSIEYILNIFRERKMLPLLRLKNLFFNPVFSVDFTCDYVHLIQTMLRFFLCLATFDHEN